MDELVHHCLRELSFDGDLGSNVSRLRDFIVDFYAQSSAPQLCDDAFCAFVWSIVVQQPAVHVGTIPQGVTSEVWIAPQVSAKRKAKERGEKTLETLPPRLEIIEDAKTRTLDSLRNDYGDSFRIAVDPDAIYAAITGSHIRFPKLSPMVYSALQIITRGRDNGVTVVALGQKSKYDQKTCFYIVRQLTEMDLVVKVRRGGVGTHFCIHKYFFERSSSWNAIRDEETRAEDITRDTQKFAVETSDDIEDDADLTSLDFTPIDERHLSSLPLIRGRIVKLLKASKNNIHASNNILVTLGFSNPTKTDRRFFQSRIRELIQQGVIEKVIVPSKKKKSNNASVKCFRLVNVDGTNIAGDEAVLQPGDRDDEDNEDLGGVKMNITIHKQIVDLIEDSRTTGMTLNELSAALGQFDKRTIELLLTRADKNPPPNHLCDLGIAAVMETSGRERRHRYYTVAAYLMLIDQEKLDKRSAGYAAVELQNGEGFFAIESASFYEDEMTLFKHQDFLKGGYSSGTSRKKGSKEPTSLEGKTKQKNRGTEKVQIIIDEVLSQNVTERPNKRKRKTRETLDMANESEGNGAEIDIVPKRRKHNKDIAGDELVNKTPLKKRGRPPKIKERDVQDPPPTSQSDCQYLPAKRSHASDESPNETVRKKRGRPKKLKSVGEADIQNYGSAISKEVYPGETTQRNMPIEKPETMAARLSMSDHSTQVPFSKVTESVKATIPIDPSLIEDAMNVTTNGKSATDSMMIAGTTAPPGTTHMATQPSSVSKTRVNVSHLRRENEMYRVIENLGGIVNIQTKEFYDAHMALLEVLGRTGEPTSAPVGTRTDKRTVAATINNLERQGRIKQFKTSVMVHTGVNRHAWIVYLSDISPDKLNAFLADISRGTQQGTSQSRSFVKIDERVEYGADLVSPSRAPRLLQIEQPNDNRKEGWRNFSVAEQLFKHDDATIREVLLRERTTLGQLYGFIVGKASRAREMHLSTLVALESGNTSPNIVSHEHRIVELSYFCHDLPLSLYCSFISSITHDDEFTQFLASEEGRQTPVKDLPPVFHTLLQIGRSRARSRFLDILDMLKSLGLVVPLQESDTETPLITCAKIGRHPSTFDKATSDGWPHSTPTVAPTYWQFSERAPLYLWASTKTAPLLWKSVSLHTSADATIYWELLHEACTNPDLKTDSGVQQTSDILEEHIGLSRSLRRSASWKSDYILTWHQTQYLKKFLNLTTCRTPLQEEDNALRNSQLERISWVISAPQHIVEKQFIAIRDKTIRELEKSRRRAERNEDPDRVEAVKLSLAKKAEEARHLRHQEWEALLLTVHPAPLEGPVEVRMERVRKRFLQAGSAKDTEKWKKEVANALKEADIAARKVLRLTGKRGPAVKPYAFPDANGTVVSVNSAEPSVQKLIEQQSPLNLNILPVNRKHKIRNAGEVPPQEKEKVIRRHRFQWNRDYDELARDASVIIKARCRGLTRLDWAAFEQVFPAVPRNTVRQRLAHIRETPGNEAYLNRLEDRWYDLWIKERGTPLLPDDDPQSPSQFDLAKHIEFLRTHVDKNALRVGFSQAQEVAAISIPPETYQLLSSYDIIETAPSAPTWDFMWNASVEEGREKRLLRQSFTKVAERYPLGPEHSFSEVVVAEAALKMAMGIPPERYDSELASTMLRSANEEDLATAIEDLLSRGVLSKSQRDPKKQKPGRQLQISENNQNAIGGSVSRDIFQDAVAVDDLALSLGEWREWPLTATDGDNAALIQLASEDRVSFKVDTSRAQAARAELDWNSKKADDDQIETTIFVRFNDSALSEVPSALSPQKSFQEEAAIETVVQSPSASYNTSQHGRTIQGEIACCSSLTSYGLIDCTACLDDEWLAVQNSLSEQDERLARKILDAVRQTGEQGLKKTSLLDTVSGIDGQLDKAIYRMTESSVPLMFWTGYSSLVLVSSLFLKKWGVVVSGNPITRILPRRWLDFGGLKVADFWEAALRAVMGVIVFRPGVTLAEVRWRLRSVYDRQEVNELVFHLKREGIIHMRYAWNTQNRIGLTVPLDEEEERSVFIFVASDRHWYQM